MSNLFKPTHKQGDDQMNDTIEDTGYIFCEAMNLMKAKNADYGDSWRKMRLPSITDQILVKTIRIRTLEESDDAPKVSEGIESEYMDILNYCVFALIKLRDAKDENWRHSDTSTEV